MELLIAVDDGAGLALERQLAADEADDQSGGHDPKKGSAAQASFGPHTLDYITAAAAGQGPRTQLARDLSAPGEIDLETVVGAALLSRLDVAMDDAPFKEGASGFAVGNRRVG